MRISDWSSDVCSSDLWMADQPVPDNSLKSFGKRRYMVRVDAGDDHRHIRLARRIPGVPPDNAEHPSPPLLRKIDGGDDIRTDVTLRIPAADRENQDGVLGIQAAHFEPSRENRSPAFIIGPSRKFGAIVSRRLGLHH